MHAQPIDANALAGCANELGLDWLYRAQTASTNTDALDYFHQHQREVVAFSEAQTAGRGRRGRDWLSPSGCNLYCTIGLIKKIPADYQGLLSILTGVALCRVLAEESACEIKLKWPNDLLHAGFKLGGILIESRPTDDGAYYFAIGFGLNLLMPTEVLAKIPRPVTSLQQVSSQPIDRSRTLQHCIRSVVDSIRAFEWVEVDQLIAQFQQFDAFYDQKVEVIGNSLSIVGINRGINQFGQLQLETEQGLETHSAAEISLRSSL